MATKNTMLLMDNIDFRYCKGLIYADQKGWPECPPGLEKEKINVLFLVKNEEISKDEWLNSTEAFLL